MRFSSCEDLKLTVPSSSITAHRCCMQMSGMSRLSVVLAPCCVDPHHQLLDVLDPESILLDQVESESSGAWIGEPTDQRLMLVRRIS